MTAGLWERDPDNRLLARGPRFRSSAEVIRDQALFASGLLSPKMFGPPVRPLRPKLGLRAAFGGGTDWDASPGEDRYRRALYTEWRRTTPYPSMATFDAPSRNVCTVQRTADQHPACKRLTPLTTRSTSKPPRPWAAASSRKAERPSNPAWHMRSAFA